MKAPIFILIAALLVGLIRHLELAGLQSQGERLLEAGPAASSSPSLSRASRDHPPSLMSEPPPGLADDVWKCFGPWRNNEDAGMVDPSLREIDGSLARMDHHAVNSLLQQLLADHPLDQEQQESLRYFIIIRRLAVLNPPEAMRLLTASQGMKQHTTTVFELWSIKRPAEALHWFDSLEGKERELIATPEMTFAVMLSQARFDPAGALSRALALEAEGRGEITGNFGSYVHGVLRGNEHLAFLTALTSAESRAPDSVMLADTRAGYLKFLMAGIDEWPFDEASELLDQGFDAEDRAKLANELATHKNLTEPARWGEWMAARGVTAKSANPLARFAQEWSMGSFLDGSSDTNPLVEDSMKEAARERRSSDQQ